VSALATFFTLAAIIGAFLAGMAFAEVAERYGLAESFEPLNAFFVPFFFLVIGLNVRIDKLLAVWPVAMMITVLAIVGKLIGGSLGARPMGRTSALIVGVGMVPRGEVGIIVAAAGLGAAAISQGLYASVVVMSIATSVLAPSILGRLFQAKAAEEAGKAAARPKEPPKPPGGPGPASADGAGEPGPSTTAEGVPDSAGPATFRPG
jgi:Kef-type K+ transport system membrane component KefB